MPGVASRIRNMSLGEREGTTTELIESGTAKIPSIVYLGLAVGAMIVSAVLQASDDLRRKEMSNFVGQWAPTFLIMGLYNKLVKQHGH